MASSFGTSNLVKKGAVSELISFKSAPNLTGIRSDRPNLGVLELWLHTTHVGPSHPHDMTVTLAQGNDAVSRRKSTRYFDKNRIDTLTHGAIVLGLAG